MCGCVAPLTPEILLGTLLGNVSLYAAVVTGSISVAFPCTIVVSIFIVSV